MATQTIRTQRIYDEPDGQVGKRILVDRLWPRGISKERAGLDLWLKDVAPSTELRRAFHDNQIDWDDFQHRYIAELNANPALFSELLEHARQGPTTLLYASKSETQNHALILRDQLVLKLGQ